MTKEKQVYFIYENRETIKNKGIGEVFVHGIEPEVVPIGFKVKQLIVNVTDEKNTFKFVNKDCPSQVLGYLELNADAQSVCLVLEVIKDIPGYDINMISKVLNRTFKCAEIEQKPYKTFVV